MRRARHRQPAQALVWVVVMLPLFLAIVGRAIAGQAVLRAHRRAQGAADGAARTGAAQIQVPHARGDPGQADLLDPAAAQRAAEAYVAETYPDLRLRATADDDTMPPAPGPSSVISRIASPWSITALKARSTSASVAPCRRRPRPHFAAG